ncbi:MAG TPA: nucleoside permease [Bacteroidales bacterium]|jgi:nucleoside transporter|nr:nucleoside permease [Bacteroidales bacterium]
MKTKSFIVLSLMMFFQYYIWGSWYVTMGTFMTDVLKANGIQIGAAYSALAIATMISPFFIGMIADRFFAAQRVMGVLHLVGGILLFMASRVQSSGVFYWVILLYSLAYMPTIGLSNSVAFRQMADPGKQFPVVRVFGTVGWVVSGFMIAILGIEKTPMTFYMASIVSFTLAIYSFFLPNTPPQAATKSTAKSILGIDALVLFKDRPYLIFFIAAIFVCIPLSFYFGFANLYLNQSGMQNAAGKMVMGQISEALFILAIPLLFNRIGVKNMILIGMSAWLMRYLFFAYGNMDSNIWMLYLGIILHGVCYDFFFVTGYMYTEKKSNERIKSTSQGLFTFVTYGLGMFIGTWFSGFVTNYYSENQVYQWKSIWFVPAAIAVIVLICFIFFFKEKRKIEEVN